MGQLAGRHIYEIHGPGVPLFGAADMRVLLLNKAMIGGKS